MMHGTTNIKDRRIVHVERNRVGFGQTCGNVCDKLEDKYLEGLSVDKMIILNFISK